MYELKRITPALAIMCLTFAGCTGDAQPGTPTPTVKEQRITLYVKGMTKIQGIT